MEVYCDAHVYDTGMITIIECMGRHAGWLTAAARWTGVKGCGPDLIYLPEVDFDLDDSPPRVQGHLRKEQELHSWPCLKAVHDKDGTLLHRRIRQQRTMAKDSFGHAQLGGLAAFSLPTTSSRLPRRTRC